MKEDAAIKLLDNVFKKSFDKDRFSQFIVELFNEFQRLPKSWQVWKEYQGFVESYESLGTYTDFNKQKIRPQCCPRDNHDARPTCAQLFPEQHGILFLCRLCCRLQRSVSGAKPTWAHDSTGTVGGTQQRYR